MFFSRWNAWLNRRFQATIETRSALPRRRSIPLALERLEARDCPAVFLVSNTADSGPGSLRAAITAADADSTGSTILISIGATGTQQTIALLSDLPALTNTKGIDIDATNQGSSNSSLTLPLVTLAPAVGATVNNGLVASADNNEIEGLNIQGFAFNGVVLGSNNNVVTFDHITGNQQAGIVINNGSANTIGGPSDGDSSTGGNLISGNQGTGVAVSGSNAFGNFIGNNFIGTNQAGTAAMANQGTGLVLANGAHDNSIGIHSGSSFQNVISGNRDNGIGIVGANTIDNVVDRNFIGSDVNGTSAIANGNDGIVIAQSASSNQIGRSGVQFGAKTLSGTSEPIMKQIILIGSNQVISGNTHFGVEIDTAGTSHNQVEGNLIGVGNTDSALPNGLAGVFIDGATNNTIGATMPAACLGASNVISGNNGPGRGGVFVIDSASGNVILGNYIGTDENGSNPLPNQANGILLSLGSTNNTIGSCTSNSGNVVSGNNGNGIGLDNAPSNVVVGNFIGTNDLGTAALANQGTGIVVTDSGSTGNTIGGSISACANVISGNRDSGIGLTGGLGTVVAGNHIGTAANVNNAIPNGFAGVAITGPASNNLIGGLPGLGNIIAANRIGVLISGSNGNQVQSNSIVNNTKAGVLISNFANNNQIGGASQGNRIFGNGSGLHGVGGVFVDSGTSNLISQNSIHDNVQNSSTTTNPGIGLNSGNNANNNVPAPVLSAAHTLSTSGSTTVTFSGSLNVSSSTTMDRVFTIEFFGNQNKDPNNFCEGRDYLGSKSVTILPNQTSVTFTSVPFTVPAGDNFFTATATDAANDTSTFSNCVMGAP